MRSSLEKMQRRESKKAKGKRQNKDFLPHFCLFTFAFRLH
jgi:hypothetical protein